MTRAEYLRVLRLLSALESVMLGRERMPDYLHEELLEVVSLLEREILA